MLVRFMKLPGPPVVCVRQVPGGRWEVNCVASFEGRLRQMNPLKLGPAAG